MAGAACEMHTRSMYVMIASATAKVVTTCRARVGGTAGTRTDLVCRGTGAIVSGMSPRGALYTIQASAARRSAEDPSARQNAPPLPVGRVVREDRQGRLHPSKLDAQSGLAGGRLRRTAGHRHLQHLVGVDAVQRASADARRARQARRLGGR